MQRQLTILIKGLSHIAALIWIGLIAQKAHSEQTKVIDLSNLQDWKSHSFVGDSQFAWLEQDQCLKMSAEKTASAKILEDDFPIDTQISWKWKQVKGFDGVDQTTKAGDDFSARIYIAVEHPFLFWKSRVLTYVIAEDQPVNSHWPNPFSEQFQMWVVSSEGDPGNPKGQWHTVSRNIKADWKQAFGDEPKRFHAIGLMVDGDNTQRYTESCLANLEIRQNN